jgi:hypothetical protein
MPSRGLITVAALVLIALACLAVSRRLDREHRLLARLRAHPASDGAASLRLDQLTDDERDTAAQLASVGVLRASGERCYLDPARFAVFRRKRMRLMVGGSFVALASAALVAALMLRS